MAGNDWINSYLEAILDVGPGIDKTKSAKKSSSLLLRERGHFNPTRYFVEEVITGFDESDLYRSWVKVIGYLFISRLIYRTMALLSLNSSCLLCLCVQGCSHPKSSGEEY